MLFTKQTIKTSTLILASTCLLLGACSDTDQSAVNEIAAEASDSSSEAQEKIKEDTMAKVKTLASNLLSEADLQALEDSDPYLWLEDVDGEKALNWVKARNKESLDYLEAIPGFKELNKKNLEVYDSDERIAYPSIRGDYVYNFWKDDEHIRGIYRRTTLAEYLKSDDPDWKTVLDIDALAESENKNWVYKGSSCLYPEYTRCILNLSIGGSDAVVRREYDLNTQSFVENGFVTKESKGAIAWLDKDTVMVGVDFGPESMTDSGYPKLSKLWKRGTPLTDAKTLFTGQQEDVGIWGYVINVPEGSYPFIRRSSTFYTGETHYYHNDKTTKLDLPKDADFNGIFKEQMLVELKSDWEVGGQVLKQGSLVSIGFENFLAGKRNFTVLYEPSERTSVAGFSTTRDHLLLSVLNNVRSELYKYEYAHGSWTNSKVDTPDLGNLSVVATNDTANDYFYTYTGFLNPNTLYYVDNNGKQRKVRSLPDFFDAGKYQVQQFEVTSKDGTKVPYFMVARKDLELNGKNPTVMYGYGGFEVSLRPSYSATIGIDWLDQGGTYVLTNIRGGGEFGPKWHHAALKEKRPRAYEDFIAIAEDLIDRKITSPQHLGIRGGSNGGLLVGAIYTMRPDLFNAVVCAVPLLDMKRYNKLLAGASWMAEYGDPDIPEQWDYIKNYSPYHNLEKNREYPKVFFYTSTKDDRVHPGHARKMVALMEEYGHPNYYYENIEGGHAGSTNNEQAAYISALTYSYFKDQLMPDSQKQAAK